MEETPMGKNRATWNYKRYLKLLKEGRGQGTGKDYKPWIEIHDFASRGLSWRARGLTTGRIHHLLSRNEMYYFILLDTDPEVTDIREQFPLRLTETLEIAECLGIKHPRKGSFPFVMTTDFLITRNDGLFARTVKETAELNNPRVLEKFSIEHEYWKRKDIDWKIVTEKQIDPVRVETLQWLYSGESPESMIPDTLLRSQATAALLGSSSESGRISVSDIEAVEEACSLPPGSAISLYKELIRSGRISSDKDMIRHLYKNA